ncbi:MAG: GreA/GreB family elongation factor [Polyangiaceae bacterium]
MNKAFTKEDGPDEPELVPARAPLPTGTPNYVTARGLDRLRAELARLDGERAQVDSMAPGVERSRALAHLVARRTALEERLASAVLVDAAQQPRNEVRFGAKVTLGSATGIARAYRIVGVDEAEPPGGYIAFVSPLAKALLGRGVGEEVTVRTPRGEEEVEILQIEYEEVESH